MISNEELKKFDSLSSEWEFITANLLTEMARELLAYREAEQANLQCWLADDADRRAMDEQEMAEDIADNLEVGGSTTEEILCSTRLPNRNMRVWLTGGENRDIHFEWVEKP